jgi:hypothetical protein
MFRYLLEKRMMDKVQKPNNPEPELREHSVYVLLIYLLPFYIFHKSY